MRSAHTHSLLVGALVIMALFSCGCAIPVRPIAKVETGADGKPHFVPDPEQEPHPEDAVPILTGLLGVLGGPWGEAGAAAIALITGAAAGHHIGHKRGRKARAVVSSGTITQAMPG